MQFTSFEQMALYGVMVVAVIGVLYALFMRRAVLAAEEGTDQMRDISGQIQEGAQAYLARQFRTILFFLVILAILLFLSGLGISWKIALARGLAFMLGALGSGLTGYLGMTLAVRANVRCTQAARSSLARALDIGFKTGGVTGMFTVTLGLLGATIVFIIFKEHATEVLLGFAFGGSLLALFMRVGGGIYTKAADVGADLVGKVEAGIPEDDPRNAAVIADNVGDNVGDCAGMAADLYESYEATLVASMILALAYFATDPRKATVWIIYPLLVRGIGVITSMIGIAVVKLRGDESPIKPINRGVVWSAVMSMIAFFLVTKYYVSLTPGTQWSQLFWATTSGLALAVIIYTLTQYYTLAGHPPVESIARSSQTGVATNLLTGFAEGMESSVWALITICGAIAFSVMIFGTGASPVDILYGVSLCGMGMLTTTGVIVAMDTYGPVSDNAQGITEMAGVEEAADNVAILDAVGNTTKAATKGIAIASAVIASVSLFGSYLSKVAAGLGGGTGSEVVSIEALQRFNLPLDNPMIFVGLLIGGAMPFLFSSMTIRAVGRTAFQIINEVRRQFREIPGLMEGTAKPESAKVVDICTVSALRELIAPGLLAVLIPVIVGCWLGWQGLGGYLAGIIVVGQLLAVLLCNSGGAWDNAKKLIEDGAYGGKGSDAHKAAVVGDTVGDPFKDTAGPSLNILIKVMNIVGLLVAPLIAMYGSGGPQAAGPWLPVIGVILAVIVGIGLILSKRESADIAEVHAAVGEEEEAS